MFKMLVDSTMSDPAVLAAGKAGPLVHHGYLTAQLIGDFSGLQAVASVSRAQYTHSG